MLDNYITQPRSMLTRAITRGIWSRDIISIGIRSRDVRPRDLRPRDILRAITLDSPRTLTLPQWMAVHVGRMPGYTRGITR